MTPETSNPSKSADTPTLRVLQVITDTDRRGAQVFAMDLAAAMRVRGHDVVTVALAPGTQASPLDVETLGSSRRGVATIRALRAQMGGVDITIAHGSSTLLACATAGFPRLPFAYRQISDSRFWANTLARRLRTALFLRRATHIVALSDEARQTLRDHVWAPPSRISVVPNGVPAGEFHPPTAEERSVARRALGVPDEAFAILYLGALAVEKGVDLAIEAAGTVANAFLIIAGDGPDRERLELLAGEQNPDRIVFLGPVSQPSQLCMASDVMLLASRGGDSMPATLIEAGLCGLPSVATPIGSIEEIVRDGETGLIVPPGDLPRLIQALNRLANDAAFRGSLGTAARTHTIDQFEISVVAESWINVLHRASETRSGDLAKFKDQVSEDQ